METEKIKIVQWKQYSLVVKEFNSIEEVEEYRKSNPNCAFVAIQGKEIYRTCNVSQEYK